EARGAVGLLVPGAGPTVDYRTARAALVRGKIENSLRGGLPSGPVLFVPETSRRLPAPPAIVLGLPRRRVQPNDRRYPIARDCPPARGRRHRALGGAPRLRRGRGRGAATRPHAAVERRVRRSADGADRALPRVLRGRFDLDHVLAARPDAERALLRNHERP